MNTGNSHGMLFIGMNYIAMVTHSQHVSDDSNTPHVCREGDKVVVDHFWCQELRRAKVDLQFLPGPISGEANGQKLHTCRLYSIFFSPQTISQECHCQNEQSLKTVSFMLSTTPYQRSCDSNHGYKIIVGGG